MESTEIILADLEERKEWEPIVPGSQCCQNRHRYCVCVLGPQVSVLVTLGNGAEETFGKAIRSR